MQVFRRALGLIGIRPGGNPGDRPDYARLMREALNRVHTAELLIQEAATLEQLDVARSAYLSAQAEVQQVIRAAKRECGIAVRPIAETEEIHRNMRTFMHGGPPERSTRRRTGTAR